MLWMLWIINVDGLMRWLRSKIKKEEKEIKSVNEMIPDTSLQCYKDLFEFECTSSSSVFKKSVAA